MDRARTDDVGMRRGVDAEADDRIEVLLVEVAHHRVGIPVEAVDEVQPAVWVDRLPGAPQVIDGVVDWRGELVPVLDARRRVGAPSHDVVPSDRLVLVSASDRRVAVRVDAAVGLAEVSPLELAAAVHAAPPELQGLGVARMSDGLVLVHDPSQFLTPHEATELDRALEHLEQNLTDDPPLPAPRE